MDYNPQAPLASDIEEDQLVCCILSPLQHACRYWVEHLQQGDSGLFNAASTQTRRYA